MRQGQARRALPAISGKRFESKVLGCWLFFVFVSLDLLLSVSSMMCFVNLSAIIVIIFVIGLFMLLFPRTCY